MIEIIAGHRPLNPGIYIGRQVRAIQVGTTMENTRDAVIRLADVLLDMAGLTPTGQMSWTARHLAIPASNRPCGSRALGLMYREDLLETLKVDPNPGAFTLLNAQHQRVANPQEMPVRDAADILYLAVEQANDTVVSCISAGPLDIAALRLVPEAPVELRAA